MYLSYSRSAICPYHFSSTSAIKVLKSSSYKIAYCLSIPNLSNRSLLELFNYDTANSPNKPCDDRRSRHQLINELLAHPRPTPALPKCDCPRGSGKANRQSKQEHSTVFPNSNRRDRPKKAQPAELATRVAPPCQPPAEKSDRVKPDTKTHLTHKNIDF